MLSNPEDRKANTTNDRDGMDMRHVNFVTGIYRSVDQTIKSELNRLQAEDAITPSCKRGCSRCCNQNIITNIAEIKTLVHYIKRNFTPDQIDDLRFRTTEWHQWDKACRENRESDEETENFSHTQNKFCPMLVNGVCSVYEARPLICRRFYVNSDPSDCLSNPLIRTKKHNTNVLTTVISITSSFETEIETFIESLKLDYQRTIALLPHKLAEEMAWQME